MLCLCRVNVLCLLWPTFTVAMLVSFNYKTHSCGFGRHFVRPCFALANLVAVALQLPNMLRNCVGVCMCVCVCVCVCVCLM